MSEPAPDTAANRTQEVVVARLRPSARRLLWSALLLILLAAAAAYVPSLLPESWMSITALALAGVIAIAGVLVPVLRWLSRSYTITTRRIVIRAGVLVRTRQELLHSRGYDVTVRRAGFQLIGSAGDVLINTGLDAPVRLRDVPHAELVQEALQDLMERSLNPVAARRQQERSLRQSGELGVRGEEPAWRPDQWGQNQ
ncbi:PH domain-containing protein [Schumannella sp. 10F1B-5-1]|uniref:PH domain-containing protein n=1 Tax=Schumannella sp. 10F1B-5-1 TaxID=2590780 RepID=UPI00113204FC|nr:PH domain-containing protein [Schumannella sp. 10F1B-5-1]TPW73554.1 PH domain-containing protein [Schumannella sp. 10F1B-5-1]